LPLKRYVYDDSNQGGSVVVRQGSTKRAPYPNRLAALRDHPGATRTSPPPDENPAWYIGDGGQWRKDPVSRWTWQREGMHAVVGALSGLLIVAALFGHLPQGLALGVVGLMLAGFLAYEITEGLRIRDWAYRDVGGWLAGFSVCVFAGALWWVVA